jgi:hypothetical protein
MLGRIAAALGVVAAATFGASGVAIADAGGAGTVTTTQHAENVVLFSGPAPNPCTNASGTFAVFTPDDPNGVSAKGPFHSWFGESSNQKNDVQHDTSTVNLTASDGSHIVMRMVDHLSTNASGVVTVVFDKANTTMRCA